ncbi:MAG: protein kinase [Pseudomonadota bacterium]
MTIATRAHATTISRPQPPFTPTISHRKQLNLNPETFQKIAGLQIQNDSNSASTPTRLANSLGWDLRNFNEYRISSLSGGSFGTIKMITNIEGQSLVVKYSKNKNNSDNNKKINDDYLIHENKIMLNLLKNKDALNHMIQVGELQESYKTFSNAYQFYPQLVFAMPRYAHDLFSSIARGVFFKNHHFGNFQQTIITIYKLLKAVAFLHEKNVTHRDLKPENILYDSRDGGWKICDFGLAASSLNGLQGKKGTLQTMAPEIFIQDEYNAKVDMWSLGCIFYEVLSGLNVPDLRFQANGSLDQEKTIECRTTNNPMDLRALPLTTPYFLRQLVVNLLLKQPKSRMTAIKACQYMITTSLVKKLPSINLIQNNPKLITTC